MRITEASRLPHPFTETGVKGRHILPPHCPNVTSKLLGHTLLVDDGPFLSKSTSTTTTITTKIVTEVITMTITDTPQGSHQRELVENVCIVTLKDPETLVLKLLDP